MNHPSTLIEKRRISVLGPIVGNLTFGLLCFGLGRGGTIDVAVSKLWAGEVQSAALGWAILVLILLEHMAIAWELYLLPAEPPAESGWRKTFASVFQHIWGFGMLLGRPLIVAFVVTAALLAFGLPDAADSDWFPSVIAGAFLAQFAVAAALKSRGPRRPRSIHIALSALAQLVLTAMSLLVWSILLPTLGGGGSLRASERPIAVLGFLILFGMMYSGVRASDMVLGSFHARGWRRLAWALSFLFAISSAAMIFARS